MNPVRGGYVALLSILLIAAISASTILILFITSLNTSLSSRDVRRARIAKGLAEACAEVALQSLTDCDIFCRAPGKPECFSSGGPDCPKCIGGEEPNPTCPIPTSAFSRGTCEITVIDYISGNDWRIRTKGIVGNITKYFEIEVVKIVDVAATVTSWKECIDFSSTPCPTP